MVWNVLILISGIIVLCLSLDVMINKKRTGWINISSAVIGAVNILGALMNMHAMAVRGVI